MSYCDDCLHKEVCGEEGVGDESMTFCRDKVISCDDAISRQAVLEIAKSSKSNWIDNSVLFKRVNELPPVTPQPKTGHWIETDKYESYRYRCSECCRGSDDITDYCPNCGAKMESEG